MSGFGSGIHNTGGPGSSAEPSMEEILASIRRILKEDDGARGPAMASRPNEDNDLLVLDDSMMSSVEPDFTVSDNKTALREAFIEAAGTPESEGLHFSSSSPLFAAPPPSEAEQDLVLYSDEPEPELVLFSSEPEPELVLVSDEPEPELVLVSDEPEPDLLLESPVEPEPLPAPAPVAFTEPEPEPEPAPAPEPAPLPEAEAVIIMPSPEPTPEPTAPIETTEPPPMSAYAETTESSLLDDHLSNAISNSIGSMVRSAVPERSTPVGRPGITLEEMVREALKPELKHWLETYLPEIVERVVRSEIERVVARIKV